MSRPKAVRSETIEEVRSGLRRKGISLRDDPVLIVAVSAEYGNRTWGRIDRLLAEGLYRGYILVEAGSDGKPFPVVTRIAGKRRLRD